MSRENVDLVFAGLERFRGGEPEFANLWHESAVLTAPDGWPERGPFEGRDAIVKQFRRIVDDYARNDFSDLRLLADEGDWVVVCWNWTAHGQASEIETTVEISSAYRIEEGQIAEAHYRWSPDEALAAAGFRAD